MNGYDAAAPFRAESPRDELPVREGPGEDERTESNGEEPEDDSWISRAPKDFGLRGPATITRNRHARESARC